jgi:hypothetical protein
MVRITINAGNLIREDGTYIEPYVYAEWITARLAAQGIASEVEVNEAVEGPAPDPRSDNENRSAGIAEEDAAMDVLAEEVPGEMWRPATSL